MTRSSMKGRKEELPLSVKIVGGFGIAIYITIFLNMQGWNTNWWTLLLVYILVMIVMYIETCIKNKK